MGSSLYRQEASRHGLKRWQSKRGRKTAAGYGAPRVRFSTRRAAKRHAKSTPAVAADSRHLAWVLEMDRLVNQAVREAQEETRRLGIPNYYEINGRIVSDQYTATYLVSERPLTDMQSWLEITRLPREGEAREVQQEFAFGDESDG